jgi:hypothetical protein
MAHVKKNHRLPHFATIHLAAYRRCGCVDVWATLWMHGSGPYLLDGSGRSPYVSSHGGQRSVHESIAGDHTPVVRIGLR